MKFYETHFEDYVNAVEEYNMHPKLEKQVFSKFPEDISKLKNVIFYGPSGIGKYSQMLKCVKRYSPSELKYEKKFTITFSKQEYHFKISDVHYEVDMGILGCNSKLLWHDIYQQIIDVVSAKTDKHGIIVCKNFNETHSELLENFYSYMQTNATEPVRLVFFLISEHISFIPDNIVKCCQLVNMSRPSNATYKKCIPTLKRGTKPNDIANIKTLKTDEPSVNHSTTIFNNLYQYLTSSTESIKFSTLRELLYDILIYDINIHETMWFIMSKLISEKYIKSEDISIVLEKTYTFFKYYNNNYRPIYHMEHYILFLLTTIHDCGIESSETA